MGNVGTGEIILIIIVILIFFGPKKIPEIAQGLGKGMREFKKAMSDVESELKNAANAAPQEQKNTPANSQQVNSIQSSSQSSAPPENNDQANKA